MTSRSLNRGRMPHEITRDVKEDVVEVITVTILRMFSSTESDGRTSSRYFGTPPVTESMSSFSRVDIRSAAEPQI